VNANKHQKACQALKIQIINIGDAEKKTPQHIIHALFKEIDSDMERGLSGSQVGHLITTILSIF
jgi:hypothetical protein